MITFHVQGVPDAFRRRAQLRRWLDHVARHQGRRIDAIAYVLMNGSDLLHYNRKYLKHDDHTDVITFPSDSATGLVGDILISYDRVRENARQYRVSAQEELHRVMVHGLLHLCGITDVTRKQKAIMRELEDRYLALR